MNRQERKLKDLVAAETQDYFKKYKGQNNAEQHAALSDLQTITKSLEVVGGVDFIAQLKEYLSLKSSAENCWATMRRLQDEEKIPSCTPSPDDHYYGNACDNVISQQFYLLMEIFEGKHNDFLQGIIDKTK